MIEIKNLHVIRSSNGIEAFDLDIEINLETGKRYFLYGENGSGKSTLIAAIKDIIPYAGSITFDGRKASDLAENEAFFYNYTELPEFLTVGDYLNVLGFSKEEVGYFLNLISIIDNRRTKIKRLSKTQKHLLGLAQIIKSQYKYIFIDELSIELEEKNVEKIMAFIFKYQKDATVLIIDHQMDNFIPYFDEVVKMEKGRIISEVKRKRSAVADFEYDFVLTTDSHPHKKSFLLCLKSFYPLYSLTFVILLAINILGIFIFYIPCSEDVIASPYLGVTNNLRLIDDLEKMHYADRSYFASDFFDHPGDEDLQAVVFSAVPEASLGEKSVLEIVKKTTVENVGEYNSFGSVLESGRFPASDGEVAISDDLQEYMNDDEGIRISVKESESVRSIEKFKVVGRLKGRNKVALNRFYYLTQNISDNFKEIYEIVSDDKDISFRIYKSDIKEDDPPVLFYTPNGEEVSKHQYFLHDKEFDRKKELTNFAIRSGVEKAIYIPTVKFAEYLVDLRSDYEITLYYDNYEILTQDRKALLDSGYTVHTSNVKTKNNTPILSVQIIFLLGEGFFIGGLYVWYRKTLADKEKTLFLPRMCVITDLIFIAAVLLSNIILFSLAGFIFSFAWVTILFFAAFALEMSISVFFLLRDRHHD